MHQKRWLIYFQMKWNLRLGESFGLPAEGERELGINITEDQVEELKAYVWYKLWSSRRKKKK